MCFSAAGFVGMASGLRLFLSILPATTCVTGLKGKKKTKTYS
jgi:hypothetical protein